MVVEEASILSPVSTERTMASDSPARSLDEIDLSALRVNLSPCVRVRVVSLSMCARACEAVEHLPAPLSFLPSPLHPHPSPCSFAEAAARLVVRVRVLQHLRLITTVRARSWSARAQRPVIEESESVIMWPPVVVVGCWCFFHNNWDVM